MSNSSETIGSEISLYSLGIPWKGTPSQWNTIPSDIIPYCTIQGKVYDASKNLLFALTAIKSLGAGTFGTVDLYKMIGDEEKQIAIKRPKHPSVDLLKEALFQWRIHNILGEYGLSFCIPEVYNIFKFKTTGDIWFSMKPYTPILLPFWCMKHASANHFINVLLQISLILEVMQTVIKVDHRDLKVNNIIIVDEPVSIKILLDGEEQILSFTFHVVFLDFGYACAGGIIDIKANDGLPPIDLCPKEGRDIFQILVSLWRIDSLRYLLEPTLGSWVRSRIETVEPTFSCLRLVESAHDLNWMYSMTDNRSFKAPLCTPTSIIKDCMAFIKKN